MAKKTSPTVRSKALLTEMGYAVGIVEHYNYFARRRIDLFGCIDMVAVKATENGVLAIQTTTSSNVSARLKKAVEIPEVKIWLEAGNRFEVHGWSKRGGRGERKLWDVRRVPLTLGDLERDELFAGVEDRF